MTDTWETRLTSASPAALRLLKWSQDDVERWMGKMRYQAQCRNGRGGTPNTMFAAATLNLLDKAESRLTQLRRLYRGCARCIGRLVVLQRRAAEKAYAPEGRGYRECAAEWSELASRERSSII